MTTETTQQGATAEMTGPEHTRSGQVYRPDVDILEKGDELLILADMPGVKPDDIDVKFEDGTLTIYGRVTNGRLERENFLLREYGVGDYYRTFRINEPIDPGKISAAMTEGA